MPILNWLLKEHAIDCAVQAEWADLYRLPRPPRGLTERVQKALDLYPCDILFVHRDAERESWATRALEIANAVGQVEEGASVPPLVRVVPVRMQEAWLLFDEIAIRKAAGNPNGRERLDLPPTRQVERIPDPKERLYELLRLASGLAGRRLSKLRPRMFAPRVSDFIDDFAPLRALPAFQSLETEVQHAINQLNLS